ncbi:MAG: Wzz/FepE/Etk N-terminal domain-containing protein, partial [Candidatus Promineifilaceae bacterium]
MSEYSDQEIDLRPYIEAVLNKWYWVVGAGVVFALIGVGIGLLRTQTFEATALVAITEPSQRVQFDPRI